MIREASPVACREGCDVLFLVKNDSGLGHIRRAVLLSKELRRMGVSSVIFSQASSLLLFDDPDLRVVNFPFLERLKSSAAEEAYGSLLDHVAARLDPRLVVEDTYPDHRYLSVPSLRGLPRLLVLRRLDPVSLDHVRSQGGFAPYRRVLVAQDQADFDAEAHTTATRTLATRSGRFAFCGPIFHDPAEQELLQVDRTYRIGEEPLVVVTAGSGGDQLNDAYAERLFTNAGRVAARCHAHGIRARFVLVLGPYYRARRPSGSPNVEIVQVEPRLGALLHRAAVVVMRPGHNVLHEALTGDAELVLVPGIPWMEGQPEFAEQVARCSGACVVDVDDADTLEARVVELLTWRRRRPRRTRPRNGTADAAAAIATELTAVEGGPVAPARHAFIVVLPPTGMEPRAAAGVVTSKLSPTVPIIDLQTDPKDPPAPGRMSPLTTLLADSLSRPMGPDRCLYVDVEMPSRLAPSDLARLGVSLVLWPDEGDIGTRMRHWLAFAGSERPSLVDSALDRLVADPQRTQHLGWNLAAVADEVPERGLLLDCTQLTESRLGAYLGDLRGWMDRLHIEPLPLDHLVQHRVFTLQGQSGRNGEVAS